MSPFPSRRAVLAAGAGLALAPGLARSATAPLITRAIPVSGEAVPVIGIGTAVIFDFPTSDAAKLAERKGVLETMVATGAKVIDTAPSYGNAEVVVGELLDQTKLRDRLFIATKIASNGSREQAIASMRASQQRLKVDKFDLMQAWNVSNANYDLGLIKEWKAQGLTRYTGITTSMDNAYGAMETVLRREKPDFIQMDYAIDNRNVEERLLPAARDAGAAVLINSPFGRNRVLNKVLSKPLPDFAAEIDATTWPQFLLKWLVSHPAVTVVTPGTDLARYITDNIGAARGRLPDEAMRKRMADYVAALPA